ncbi:iron complex outermembrane receptor protein [Sphingomonas kyeonggiensis]|uniref:Iron complex outermembrane receptor protein n=1 Tax=Sphingomonas kyeonggiensis TaxID=1268553 RepID=A0A7W7NTK0_9SPHN|nr:TonB-dependent receptor [Sphingomonas kyeonggiensis]MBB4839986.1 iron complex outermembrane receptor protein [Sphingomonas kyeonggiensis]
MRYKNYDARAACAGIGRIGLRLFGGVAVAAIAAPLALISPAQAQSGATGDEQDAIVVVGSRSGNKALESSAPVQLVSGEDLQATGARTLSEALQRLVPSFNFPTSVPSSNAASFVKGVSLRGLAADETLVLINGKRRHATAQLNAGSGVAKGAQTVDLNSIPLSAIERVEVLLDGASAQYGSDAIAGVVNIVLKKQAGHGNLAVQYGVNDQGDGETKSIEGSIGAKLPGEGSVTLAFDVWDIGRTRLSGRDNRTMYFAGDPREASFPNRNWFYGSGATKRENLLLNAESTVGGVTLYLTGSYGWRKDEGFGNLRQPNADQTVRVLFPDGFQPFLRVHSRDASIGGGARWSGKAGDFDLGANYGRNRVESLVYNTNNASLGTASPTSFNTGDLLNEQANVTFDWKRPFETGLLRGPLNVAAGLAYRHEAYQVFEGDYGSWANGGVPILDGPNAGKVATPASQGFGGFSPDDAGRSTRDVVGGYLELETELAKGLRVTASGRVEHYSDFGTTANARLALRYEVTPKLAWRGSAGTGYRAPSLGQSAYSRTIPNITNGVLATNKLARVDSAVARALGATALKPEKATNLSTGLVWTPSSDLSVTVDFYQTTIDDRIALSETLTGTLVRQVLTSAGFPTYSGAQYFTNAVDTRTRGIDATARYRWRLGEDQRLDLSAGFNLSDTKITHIKATPAVLAGSGLSLIGHEARGLIEEWNPDTFVRLAADYTNGGFDAHLSSTRYGIYWARNAVVAYDQRFGPQEVVNFSAGYRLFANARVSAGINNLLDSHPDQVLPAARNPVVALYSGLSPEGGAGRTYFARLDLSF